MNNILKLAVIVILTLHAGRCCALEDIPLDAPVTDNRINAADEIYDITEDFSNAQQEYSVFDNASDKEKAENKLFKIEENSLFSKIYKMQVERTSVATHVLQDELTFKLDKGPVDKIQFFGAYQGNLSNLWGNGDYDLNYDWGFINAGVVGYTKDPNTSFLIRTGVKPNSRVGFWHEFIADAYVMNTKIPHHRIIAGYSRNQTGVNGGAGAYTESFVMRSQIARTFGNTRALGLRVVGDYSLVDYDLMVSSSDRYWREFFPGAEFTGWVNFKPLGKTDGKWGKLIIGGGINAGKNETSYTVCGAYIGYTFKRFFTNFEYAIADGYNGIVNSANKASGFYTTAGYKITPKLQLVVRYDQFDPNRNIDNDLRTEISTGLNYFIKGQGMRLILNYVYCKNENSPDSSRIVIGTQILL